MFSDNASSAQNIGRDAPIIVSTTTERSPRRSLSFALAAAAVTARVLSLFFSVIFSSATTAIHLDLRFYLLLFAGPHARSTYRATKALLIEPTPQARSVVHVSAQQNLWF